MDLEESKKRIADFIEKDEDELETHFVENPFIKIREKANRKQLDSNKNAIGADELQEDADTTAQQDIYFSKDDNRLVVQDLEHMELEKKKEREMKRKRRDTFGYGNKEDISDDSGDEDAGKGNRKDGNNHNLRNSDVQKLSGMSASAALKQIDEKRKAG